MDLIVDSKYKLEKHAGKGGWTYAHITEMHQDKNTAFGMIRVSGNIDAYKLDKCTLMPMGNGQVFLPVKADIRKYIGKKEGDWVHIVLYKDNSPFIAPTEFLLCLDDEPRASNFFNALSESEKRFYINWIYSAKKEDTKINRIAKTIDRLNNGLKMYEKKL